MWTFFTKFVISIFIKKDGIKNIYNRVNVFYASRKKLNLDFFFSSNYLFFQIQDKSIFRLLSLKKTPNDLNSLKESRLKKLNIAYRIYQNIYCYKNRTSATKTKTKNLFYYYVQTILTTWWLNLKWGLWFFRN